MAEHILERGYIQIYTGNGKGKSTAAFGLAMRMAGNGGRVYIARFMKGRPSGEFAVADCINATDRLSGKETGSDILDATRVPNVEYADFGSPKFIIGTPSESDINMARNGLRHCESVISGGEYDLVVLDEIVNALYFGLLTEDEVLEILAKKAVHTELVLTGRNAPQRLIETADLVTEMKDIKHYFNDGVPARRGIEE